MFPLHFYINLNHVCQLYIDNSSGDEPNVQNRECRGKLKRSHESECSTEKEPREVKAEQTFKKQVYKIDSIC